MIDYHIDRPRRLILARVSGPLTGPELFEFQAELAADPSHDDSFIGIVDLRGVTMNSLQIADVREIAAKNIELPTNKRRKRTALISDRDDVFGMGRMFQMLADIDTETRVFRGLDEALNWLHLKEEDVPFFKDSDNDQQGAAD